MSPSLRVWISGSQELCVGVLRVYRERWRPHACLWISLNCITWRVQRQLFKKLKLISENILFLSNFSYISNVLISWNDILSDLKNHRLLHKIVFHRLEAAVMCTLSSLVPLFLSCCCSIQKLCNYNYIVLVQQGENRLDSFGQKCSNYFFLSSTDEH